MSIFKNSRSVGVLIFSFALGMMSLFIPIQNTAAETPSGITADKAQDLFALANDAYIKGKYDLAIKHYKAVLREGYTPSLLYNLGNAYYMKNDIGQSILSYERALYLDPGNVDIKTNLALARKKFGLVTPHQAAWKTFFNGLTLNQWTWAGVITLVAFSMMIFLNGIRPGILRGTALKMMACLCFLLFTVAGTGMVLQYGNLNRGVIIADNAFLRVSPFDSAAESGLVKNGKVVQLAKNYKGYIFINGENDQSGWIAEDKVKAILPEAGHFQTQTSLTQSTVGTINGGGGEPNMDKTQKRSTT